MNLAPRASACTDLTTEDNRTPITTGQRLYNYYDCKWGTVGPIGTDGWFDFVHEDGTHSILNGVRVSTINPREPAVKATGTPTHEYTFSVRVLHTVTVTAATMRDGRFAATEALADSGEVESMDLELIDGEPF